jgi:hypothetical protein
VQALYCPPRGVRSFCVTGTYNHDAARPLDAAVVNPSAVSATLDRTLVLLVLNQVHNPAGLQAFFAKGRHT